MKYAFIQRHRHFWPVGLLCRVLQVARSGYYAWRVRPASWTTRWAMGSKERAEEGREVEV